MKRDMDLIRDLLLWMEAQPSGRLGEVPEFPSHDADTVAFHFYLLKQSGLIEGKEVHSFASKGPEVVPIRLTPAGMDYLASLRDRRLWKRALRQLPSIAKVLSLKLIELVWK